MLFTYTILDENQKQQTGQIEAVSQDVAIRSLQRRKFIVIRVEKKDDRGTIKRLLPFFDTVPLKDIVLMSRQLSTLFSAQVSAVKAFDLIGNNIDNATLRDVMLSVSQDIQGGITIAQSMQKYPQVFSDFYVNMTSAGEESGKLTDTFEYLASYLERQYELTSKTKNALIYPSFVIFTFLVVMILMFTLVIPKLSEIIIDSGQSIPIYTRIVIAISNFFVDYWWFLLLLVIGGVIFLWFNLKSDSGRARIDEMKLKIPYIGDLFKKVYLSRIADNINTMWSAGIPIVRTLEITSTVVDNRVYQDIMLQSVENVKAGNQIWTSFNKFKEFPAIFVQMVQVGEETGSLGQILETLARFYKREVDNAVDTLIGLIEPAMIILLGAGVGLLLVSILVPIYNISTSIQ